MSEADLHARHRWLVAQTDFRERMLTDPDFYDAKIAGWWVWGISQWIGSGWCIGRGGRGVTRKLPDLSGGRGIHASALHRKMPKMDRGTRSRLIDRREALVAWFEEIASRLRSVRITCGDWKRVLGPSPTVLIGTTAVFLDPPYDPRAIANGANKADGHAPTDALYAHHDPELSREVREWALAHGDDPRLRIALCGYEGEHDMPETWLKVAWKSRGGYSNQGRAKGRLNRERERIWFSPHCLTQDHGPLFASALDGEVAT